MPSVSPILNLRNEKLNVKLHEYQTMVQSWYFACEKSADLPVHQGSVIRIFFFINYMESTILLSNGKTPYNLCTCSWLVCILPGR